MNHEKWENVTGTTILIVVGLCAGTVSFTHVIAWTVLFGQTAMVGLVNALVTELLQIAAGLELKRRRRTGRSGWRAHRGARRPIEPPGGRDPYRSRATRGRRPLL